MVPSNTLLSLVLIALTAVGANPVSRRTGKATLSFATKINGRGTLNIVEKDRARAQTMKQADQLGKRSTSQTFSVANNGVTYTADVGIGNPPAIRM
jgi:saccharopepsin